MPTTAQDLIALLEARLDLEERVVRPSDLHRDLDRSARTLLVAEEASLLGVDRLDRDVEDVFERSDAGVAQALVRMTLMTERGIPPTVEQKMV